ncbi:MAG TPA: transcriptional regulator [Xanthobacteraceae bacterium]|jgi:predicted transcriptional regulator|nr:transcriptional regulator [Xanthobacteraceae bacterium]
MPNPPLLDPIFHQTVRTRLGSLLNAGTCSFAELKTRLGVTDGNLDAHLRKLSAAGYLHSRMVVKDRVQTNYSLSPSGKRAFAAYVAGLRAIIGPPRTHHGFADAGMRATARAKRR